MKKILFSVIALSMGMMAMAAETAYVQIKLTGVTGQQTNSVYLTEDDAYTSAYEAGADAEKIMSLANSKSVLMYARVADIFCGDVVTNQLDGLKLGFTTNQVDTDYKLTFINVSGRPLKLFDRVAGQLIDITDNGEYAFSVDASLVGQKQITNRFEIGEPAKSLCFRYNTLEVIGYMGKSLVVKEAATGTEIVNEASLGVVFSKDLSDKHGRLIVVLDGKEIQIDATPDVTPAN